MIFSEHYSESLLSGAVMPADGRSSAESVLSSGRHLRCVANPVRQASYDAEGRRLIQAAQEVMLRKGKSETGRSLGAQAVTVREEKDLTVAAEAISNGAFPLLIEIKADPARRTPECSN